MDNERGDQTRTPAGISSNDGIESANIADFYDALSPFYHLIYQDWPASIERQGDQLRALIRERWGEQVHSVLDAACGIGTQSLALAARGYRVIASDISRSAIERATREAARRDLDIEFIVDDMRTLDLTAGQAFDLVIACDNAIPHLSGEAEIRAVFAAFHRRLQPGGGCIISVRDYAGIERQGTRLVPFGVRRDGGTRFVVFQVWEFDDEGYDLNFYFLEDPADGAPITHVMRSRYYAVTTGTLVRLMREVGFRDVERLDDHFFQPLIVGTRP
jgi:SAM-dependent methyltransferase